MRLLPLLLLVGCTWHLPKNAPGIIDPRQPPPLGVDVEAPGDPGETITSLTAGGYAGAGVGFGGEGWDGAGLATEAGAEVGLHWGDTKTSHVRPDLIPWPHGWPPTSVGVNVGASFMSHDGETSGLGHVFIEAQHRPELVGGYAGGWGYSPLDGAHGPHFTVFWSSLYLRGGYMFGRGAALMLGLVIKLPVLTWVESH